MRLLVTWKGLKDEDLQRIEDTTGATVLRGLTDEDALKWAPQADVILGGIASGQILAEAVNCSWMQSPFAGVEKILAMKWGNPRMVLTNGRGVFGPNIAEHVLGFLMSFNRGLHLARDNQTQRIWQPRLPIPFRELTGSTVGILGFGDIGHHVAKRLSGFDRFEELLGDFDYLICALPETSKTIGFLNRILLQRLPENAIVINVGRGSLIPSQDLILALQEKWIAGAALDVTDAEPLPADSPLWCMPNVIITPHNSGSTVFLKQRVLQIFFDNWRHFRQTGSPQINVVRRSLGY